MHVAFAQNVIKGTVVDTSGAPMAGVSVALKGTAKGTNTGADGAFSIAGPTGSTLVFSYVGFTMQEVSVVSGNALNVRMQPAASNNAEVVVTALGIKKDKRTIGFATQEVKGASLEKAREPNIIAGLTGKVAGLTIYNSSTLFENQDIYLRGMKNPLIVIDGIPTQSGNNGWNLNPDDIDNINVLKSNAAALLYGSLGKDGALQITTKRGKAGANGTEIAVNETSQLQAGALNIPKVQNQYGMGWNGEYAYIDGHGGGGWYDNYGYVWGPKLNQKDPTSKSGWLELPQYNSPYDPTQLFEFKEDGYTDYSHYKPIPWITRSSDNLSSFLRNEFLTTTNVSISGKSDKADYRISVSHMYQKGQIPNTKLNSTTIDLSGSVKINDKIKAEASLSFNRQYTPNYPSTGYGPNNYFYNILLWMGPDVNVNDLRNYWQPGKQGTQQFTYNYSWYNNPWYLANEYENSYIKNIAQGQGSITYNISKDLNLMVRSGGTISGVQTDLKTPFSFINYGSSAQPYGGYSLANNNSMILVTDAILTYKKTFLKDFDATVRVGAADRYEYNTYFSGGTQGGLQVPEIYTLQNSISKASTSNSSTEKEVHSVYGTVDLGYKNWAYANVSLRNDWSSALQKPYNSFLYPSVSLSLVLSEMVHLPKIITFAKLRGAWADVSSDFNPYTTLATYSSSTRWNGTPSLYLPGSLITPGLQPDRTISREVGIETKFYRNIFGFEATYYNYLDDHHLLNVPISQASGYSNLTVNSDVYNRRGIELSISATPIKTRDFQWDLSGNYSRIRNYVKELYGGAKQRDMIKVGDRINVDWQDFGYNYSGYAWQKSPDGKIVYENGVPQYINQSVVLGLQEPDWEFGFNTSFRYKAFSLSISVDGRIGGKMYDGVEAKLYEGGMNVNTANHYRDEAYKGQKTYVGDGVVVTGGDVTYDFQGKIISDSRKFGPNTTPINYIDYIFNTYVDGIDQSVLYSRTFVKLREVIISYTFPQTLLKKTFIKSASVSLVGRNLLLFTKVPYMDPDGYSGISLAEPTYRNIGVNLNVKF